ILEFLDKMIFLLVISFLTSLQSEKVLSKWKKCGDQECATAMSRVQATKDYTGLDCRYLNFRVGEEIIVYSKLSRKQTNLWVGSKGKDFGYFPKDAVKVDEVFITQEVEIPTKTDFLCLDGGEYSFENKDSLLHEHDEDNEYPLPYTKQKELESKELKGGLQKHASFLWDHEVELDPANVEADIPSRDLHMQEETTSNEMSRKDRSGNDDAVHPEAQSVHPSAPTQATWTVSSVARWLNLGSKHDEETTERVSKSVEENTFRSRKIAVAEESDLKELNEEDEPKPTVSGWFQSGLTDILYFSRESIGRDLPSDENDPQAHHSSSMAGHSDHELRAAATETSMDEEQQQCDKEDSDSSWFNLELPDVLTFGHAKKDETIINEEQSSEAEDTTDKTEKMQTSNQQETEFHEDGELKKQPDETTDEKQTDKKNVVRETVDSDSKTPSSGELPTNRDTLLDFKSTSDLKETSFAGEVAERNKLIEPYSSEQSSVSESQVLKNTEVKKKTQESENKNGQSGWYKNIYSNFINLNKDLSDNQDHESVVVQSTQQPVPSWISSFPSSLQSLDPMAIKNSERKKDERYKGLKPLLSFSYFTNKLNFQSSATEVEEYVQPAQEDLSFSEEHPQTKNSDKILQVSEETAEKLQANQKVSERVQEKRDVDMSQESV
uniref:SH3 domain-containing protein n=1 Tax=Crocodylus porosus TaxID=8502 RepID=A0A7M4E785_CROPO